MKDKHNNRLLMFGKIINVMDKNTEKWNTVPEVKKTVDEFVKNYKKLNDLKLEEDHDLRPYVQLTVERRNELVQKLFPVTSLLNVYAFDHGNGKLNKKLDRRKADLMKMKDRNLFELVDLVIKTAQKLLNGNQKGRKKGSKKQKQDDRDGIRGYGLNESMLEELKTLGKMAEEAKRSLRRAEKEKVKSAERLKRISKENNRLLKKKLDGLMVQFEESDPVFYTEYLKARKNLSPGKTAKTTKTTTAGSPGQKKGTEKRPASPPKTSTSQRKTPSGNGTSAPRKQSQGGSAGKTK